MPGGFEDRRDEAAEFLHAHRLVEVAAQVFLESHGLQHVNAIAQRDFLIGVPEEAGIVEAGAQHAFVAVANQAVRISISVEHREKVRRQLSVGVFEREVLLVIAHDGDQNFGGQREKFGIEVAENYRGEFRKVDDGVEQRLVFAPARAWNGARRGIERFADALLAVGGADGDKTLREARDVVDGTVDRRPTPLDRMRWPSLVCCRRMPANSTGTTCSSSSETIQRTGRTKRSADLPRQYMLLAQ